MKKVLFTALVLAASTPAMAQIGVSIGAGEPGLYGQINIGDVPQPQVVYAQPVVIQRAPEYVNAPPIYLHVPPGHERHWSQHCAEYRACGRPVYFVRDDWYQREYVPRHRHDDDRRDDRDDHGPGRRDDDRDHGRDHDRDDR